MSCVGRMTNNPAAKRSPASARTGRGRRRDARCCPVVLEAGRLSVGCVERSETHRDLSGSDRRRARFADVARQPSRGMKACVACRKREFERGDDGFRCALPILRFAWLRLRTGRIRACL
ncbi:hypothetical protein LUTEI9C_40107 [Luteimonas sp. 9C]|nr:hypothetical protein LUTEI9C_40107 [Luteimonas sp. 9C]